jgi:hypothetical protein
MAKAGTVSRALAERFFFELFGDNSISYNSIYIKHTDLQYYYVGIRVMILGFGRRIYLYSAWPCK